MLARARGVIAFFAALAGSGCGASELHVAGAPPASQYVEGFSGGPTSATVGSIRLRSEVCRGVDLRPAGRPLDADDFIAYAKRQGLETRVVRARHDLVFVDLLNAGTNAAVRFRVAILDTPGAAGHELHGALLQRGSGTWGLHRGNLAVLAPAGPTDDIVVLASKLRLACWGVLMIAGLDDTFVVPGGYTEL